MESENTTNESEIIAKTTNNKQAGPMMGEIDGTNSDSSAGDGTEMNGAPEMPSGKEGEMWRIEGLATGSYQVYAHNDSYYDGNASCMVFEGETSVCHIALTPIPNGNNSEHIETGVLPTVTINTVSDCSAQPVSKHHAPFALLAIASGLLASLGIRRRKAKGGSR